MEQKKKIAFVANSAFTFGGEQRVLCMVANHLQERYDITIISPDEKTDIERNPFGLSKDIRLVYFKNKSGFMDWNTRRIARTVNRKTGCFNTASKAKFMCDMYYPPKKREELASMLQEGEYDYVVGIAGYNAMLVGLIADQLSGKTIGWQHNSYEAYFETPGLYYWNQFEMFRYAVGKLDRCFVLNEYIARKYQENLGISCDVFYNPRSFQSEKKAELKEHVFVACGEMNYRKGFDYLIEAFAEYVKLENTANTDQLEEDHVQDEMKTEDGSHENENIPWKLMMLGDGEKRSEIESKITFYGLQDRVILKGNVSNVNELLLDTSVFLLSSRWEGFPMVITEALEIGLPIVSFDITAMEPLVTDGMEGILVKAYDCKAFAKAMMKLSENESLRRQMGQKALEKSPSFSVEKIIGQWIETLESL